MGSWDGQLRYIKGHTTTLSRTGEISHCASTTDTHTHINPRLPQGSPWAKLKENAQNFGIHCDCVSSLCLMGVGG